ncbi:mediator of RNA polymerase II transcription subunit 33A-like [Ananas comosus]|uniref:Mediator of RNA polymerase II transcription subunit 33A-like n=1 Tax=Ananas comosus TaxID=4615 RepID=A0A6P5FYK5_ANACO|nr:mediator of RNA polymerase II transcription subunit 33A-like [Ananas comosus]
MAAAAWGAAAAEETKAAQEEAAHLGRGAGANAANPLAWKYAERALSSALASPLLLLSLLSTRVIPSRRLKPTAYRLYMELLRRHGFSFVSQIKGPNFKRTMMLVDDNLQLSKIFGFQAYEPGVFIVAYVTCTLWQLLDAALDDEDLLELTPEKKAKWPTKPQDVSIIGERISNEPRVEHSEKLHKMNTKISVEIIGHFLRHKVISRLLCLARENMPSQWGSFASRLHLLATKSSALRNSTVSVQLFQRLIAGDWNILGKECKQNRKLEVRSLISFGSRTLGGYCLGASPSALWIPIDLYLEDCIDGSVAATNSIELLSGLVMTLQAVNGSTWHDAFLALWMASLRLVQRERDPHEGPVPRLDARLSMLLSITTLSIADIIEEDEALVDGMEVDSQLKDKAAGGKRCKDLVSSLQTLGDYESLLAPPPSIISAANQAAAKALMFVSGINVGGGYTENININDKALNCPGNLRHLIVEACISRNLLDTSAYFWPGYIAGRINQIPHSISSQLPGWSSFMKGAPLSQSMVNSLVSNPAASLAELEKIFEIAINGSDDDKVSAATVLCGASLLRGWNIQEHTVRLVVKLLSPPVPPDYTGSDSHLINHGPMLNVLLTGISSVDCVQVFSFHGLVPALAAALMAICEVFGSCFPSVSRTLATGEEITAHAVFSNAFILLLRLWKFNHPPLEYCILGDGAPVGSQLTPEYLLLLRNARVLSPCKPAKNQAGHKAMSTDTSLPSPHPIFMDSFPKLKHWYRQHQACLASTLSGLVHGTPVHQNVDGLLRMMFRKINKGGNQSVGPVLSGSSSLSTSSGAGSDDTCVRPNLPAWDILEAVPFVVDAALAACSHGRLFPRELATGLKDLADFLPASLATIVSYFSAEVTRGVWKPAFMNGSDWPSPAANLSIVEEQIKKIVAATGVDVPSLVAGGSFPATLPLPLAAFVSLTITYKLDKASERFLNLAGPALENLAASCPWPSMPIVAALWTQKVKRWSDFLVFSASRTVFHHNNDAVVQLLRSCFSATVGLSGTSSISGNGGVGSLLGHGFGSHFSGGLTPVAPGILYLRIYRCIKDVSILAEEILSLLMLSVKEIAETTVSKERSDRLKRTKHGMRYEQVSLAAAMTRVKVAAALGATFVWLSGGSRVVQSLIQEMLPSWFLSVHDLDQEGGSGPIVYMLGGYALAYFAVLSGMFAWGIDSTPVSKRRPRVVQSHFEFLASALDGKITLGCDWALWRAYVSGFLGLVVECAPSWVLEVGLDGLKRLSRGLRRWNEDELALALLRRGGVEAMGTAAELILAGE